MYSLDDTDLENSVEFFLDPENGYFGIFGDNGRLEGFCNFGYDAQVTGGDYTEEAIDIGISLHPDLVGRGLGSDYAARVFSEARSRYPGLPLRVTIATFNQRSIRICEKHGFAATTRFTRDSDGQEFIVLVAG